MSSWLTPLLILLLAACAPSVRMRVLQPADLPLPQHIDTIVVIDRSGAKNVGQGVLGVLEGALTGEGIAADTQGRQSALTGIRNVVNESPQYQLVYATGHDPDPSLFDKPLPWPRASAICNNAGCQAIVALESFDSDVVTTVNTRETTDMMDGEEKIVLVYEAIRDTTVHTSWRVYDVENKVIVDELHDDLRTATQTSEADSEDNALSSLPSNNEVVQLSAYASGEAYGRRIAPNYIFVSRDFYGTGGPTMKAARKLALSSQWSEAAATWRTVFQQATDPKLKAKAAYNIALSHEVRGDLDKAMTWQGKAARHWSRQRIRSYGSILAARIADAQALQSALPNGSKPE